MIRYRLGPAASKRRAGVGAAVRAASAVAPLLLAAELLPRLGWALSGPFAAVVAALVVLVAVRAAVQYRTSRRRLASLRVTLDDDAIVAETSAGALAVPRARAARIVEIDGALGGIRVESAPDEETGVVVSAGVPRGGEGFAEVRARLARWGPIERRARRGAGVLLLVGAAVVGAVFFLPFVLDDFVERSRLLASGIVVLAWLAIRWAMRGAR